MQLKTYCSSFLCEVAGNHDGILSILTIQSGTAAACKDQQLTALEKIPAVLKWKEGVRTAIFARGHFPLTLAPYLGDSVVCSPHV